MCGEALPLPDTQDCFCPPGAHSMHSAVGVSGLDGATAASLCSSPNQATRPHMRLTHSFSKAHHLLWNWSMFPRLPISSARSSDTKTDKCFPKEMSDVTPFPQLLVPSLPQMHPAASLIPFVRGTLDTGHG